MIGNLRMNTYREWKALQGLGFIHKGYKGLYIDVYDQYSLMSAFAREMSRYCLAGRHDVANELGLGYD